MIKVLHKALNILELLSRNAGNGGDGLPLSVIASEIGEKPTTAANIIGVLYRRGYLDKGPSGYRLGVSAYLLTGSARDYDRVLPDLSSGPLERLTEETRTAAVLSVWRGSNRYVLLRVADTSEITVNGSYPYSAEVYRTATGMLLLAFQSAQVIGEYIRENGTPQGEEAADFLHQLASIRENRLYCRERGDVFEAACPVTGSDGSVTTAIGVYLPVFRAGDRTVLTDRLKQAAAEIESSLARKDGTSV